MKLKKKRFIEGQIIAALKRYESSTKIGDAYRELGIT